MPAVRALVVSCAVPPDSATVAKSVVPSLKTTLPVGVPTLAVTVAVNVTGLPCVLGEPEETTRVVVASLATVCVKLEELAAYFGEPPYCAVIASDPAFSTDVLSAALPFTSLTVPSVAFPFLKETLPRGVPVPEVIVAVNVTD